MTGAEVTVVGGLGKLMAKVALELSPEGCVCVRDQSVGCGILS